MKTDSYFEIGSSHDVCQDFALTGKINENISFAIVSDGCTESHKRSGEVDFGARIMSYAARETLKTMLKGATNLSHLQDPKIIKEFNLLLRQSIIRDTKNIGGILKLSDMFADCTMVIVVSDGQIANTFIFGDGGIIVKKMNGDIIYREVSFLSSAPYYLIYTQDKGRNDGYRIQFGASPLIVTTYVIDGVSGEFRQANEVINTIDEGIYDKLACSFDSFVSVSAVSDGIKSFQKTGNPIISAELASKFIAFKNQNPGFLQRRFNFIKKEHKDEDITHYDDVSVATVLL